MLLAVIGLLVLVIIGLVAMAIVVRRRSRVVENDTDQVRALPAPPPAAPPPRPRVRPAMSVRAAGGGGLAVVTSGQAPPADQSAKIVTLVNMVADLTRRAATSMKQGDVKQVLVFGTDGLVMVCPAKAGVLAAVAGGGVKVGLLRIALNDCLKRLAEVS